VEDFDVLSSDRFMLEVEMDEVSEAQGFRSKVEAILRELKLDWATAEFDEEDTMLAKKMSRLPGNWD
jgi:hypothetical protein